MTTDSENEEAPETQTVKLDRELSSLEKVEDDGTFGNEEIDVGGALYIKQLELDRDTFKRKSWGDARKKFCLQSISKPFTYAVALNDMGADSVHKFVGTEPSGRNFNEICLDRNDKPHNPMVNAGAIICSSLIKQDLCSADRFDFCFSQSSNLLPREVLDFYFQLCSIEVDCDSAAVMAATLANGGVCPTTGDRCLSNQSCRDTLSLMYSCGMYDYSGMFAFKVGLPAKSGVSGGVVLVVPNVCGFCIYSPPLDAQGNSARAVRFCEELVEIYNFHNYDSLICNEQSKFDPRRRPVDSAEEKVMHALFAAKAGDLSAMKRMILMGCDLNQADYDGRTALHVAASEGHSHLVTFLVRRCKVHLTPMDRWGHTPLDDAKHFGKARCAEILEAAMLRVQKGQMMHSVQWAEAHREHFPALKE